MEALIGRSLELYYVHGHPEGIVTAELFNWTGHVLMFPRTEIKLALSRPEASNTGVYLLLGDNGGEPRAYVGEGEDIGTRIRQHDLSKEWWTSAVLITASNNRLNKAHIRYLEARLIAQARSVGQMVLDNGTNPSIPGLIEADVAKMEAFLEVLFFVLPSVRVDLFLQRVRSFVDESRDGSMERHTSQLRTGGSAPLFEMALGIDSLHATARLVGGEFIVQAGSTARLNWVSEHMNSYTKLRTELLRAQVLVAEESRCVFRQDYAFRSPSAAAAVICGRPANGQTAWRTRPDGLTYREWEARQIQS